jgi:hypothetical protein
MTTEHLAIYLAEQIEAVYEAPLLPRKAAAELRRLHAELEGAVQRNRDIYGQLDQAESEIDALRKQLKMAHLEYSGCMEDLKEAKKALAPEEPVAWMYFDSDGDAIFGHPNGYRPSDAVPVYAAPQPQQWVGLTDEEVDELDWDGHHVNFAHAIAAKLRERNGGEV